ncbi:hypothetical protein [Mycobacterium sp. 155]|uniref:hypothetical protein n=1 Tax=Mycobacterium sp. 155 TaxID=1157943 RepID=UPI00047834CC|nr:hypothetical protein [Mycobacterium sp. 155]
METSPTPLSFVPGRIIAVDTDNNTSCWRAAVARMRVGDHIQSENPRGRRTEQLGKPLSPKTRRTYIRDLQDWDWIPRRFDPARALEPRAAFEPGKDPTDFANRACKRSNSVVVEDDSDWI